MKAPGHVPNKGPQLRSGVQLMHSSYTPGTKKSPSDPFLKTTTWGRRLAFLTLIALLAAGGSLADGKKHKLSKDLDAVKGGHNGATVDVIIQFNQTPTAAHPEQDYVGGGTDDFYGHGTHVSGIAGSTGKGSTCSNCTRTFKGVAPNVNLINLRVLSQNGTGTDSAVITAIQKAISLKNTYNIRVINLSLGRPVQESYKLDPLCQAVEAAWNAGIVVVAAAGNDGRDNSAGTYGYGTIAAPGNDPYVITVGAMKTTRHSSTTDATFSTYSSKGPTGFDQIVKPDLVAPGNRVVSDDNMAATLPKNYTANIPPFSYYQTTNLHTLSNQYFTLICTSMATPVVSGAAQLLLQQYPNLTPHPVQARLLQTCSKTFPDSSTVT